MLSGALYARDASMKNERKALKKLETQAEEIANLQQQVEAEAARAREAEEKVQEAHEGNDAEIAIIREEIENQAKVMTETLRERLEAEIKERKHAEATVKLTSERLHGEQKQNRTYHEELAKIENTHRELSEALSEEQAAHGLKQKLVHRQQCGKLNLERELVRASHRLQSQQREREAAEKAHKEEAARRALLEERNDASEGQLAHEQLLRLKLEKESEENLAEIKSLREHVANTEKQLQQAQHQLAQLQDTTKTQLQDAKSAADTSKQESLRLELELEAVTGQLHELERLLEHSDSERMGQVHEIQYLMEQNRVSSIFEAERSSSQHQLHTELETERQKVQRLEAALEQEQNSAHQLQSALDAERRNCSRLQQQLSEHQASRESVCAIANKVLTLQHVMESRINLQATSPTSPSIQSTATSPLSSPHNWTRSPNTPTRTHDWTS